AAGSPGDILMRRGTHAIGTRGLGPLGPHARAAPADGLPAIIRRASLAELLSGLSGKSEHLDTAVSCPRCQIPTEWPRWVRETRSSVDRSSQPSAFLVGGDELRCRR